MINPQWLELPMSHTNFHGPKDVRAIEVRLYANIFAEKMWIAFAFAKATHIFSAKIPVNLISYLLEQLTNLFS